MNVGFAFALAAAVTWGLVYAIDQKLLTQISPLALLFLDSVITVVVLAPFLWYGAPFKNVLQPGGATLVLVVISALMAILAGWFILAGIQLIGAPDASVIEIAYPFFVVFFSIILYGFQPTLPFVAGGVFIFAGAALITWYS